MECVNIKKICLVISSLQCGGAERVMMLLANAWVDKNIEVTIITFRSAEGDFYQLDGRIKRLWQPEVFNSKGKFNAIANNFRRVMFLKNSIVSESPDCVISFLAATNILALIATFTLKIPVFVSERTDPRHYSIGFFREISRKLLYPRANAVIVQTESVAKWFARKNPRMKIVVVPNPVRPIAEKPYPPNITKSDEKVVVAMGRLTEEKGFDILISAFAQCLKHNLNWTLVIVGGGPLLNELKLCAESLHVDSQVIFKGVVNNPESVLKNADLFVLSSIAEGFPNALLEAMCCGLPVISFDCDSGPADMIVDGVNGALVSELSDKALSSAMMELMENEGLQKSLGMEALKVKDKFSMENILGKWNTIIADSLRDN